MPSSESSLRAFARRYVIALGLAALTMVLAIVMVNYVFNEKFSKIERVDVDTVESPTEVANYLLIGSDTRAFVTDAEDEAAFGSQATGELGQRSDTLMVIHVDPIKHHAVVVSFPRDLWVEIAGVPLDDTHCTSIIEGKCMSRINSAFGSGPDVVIQTLQQNFQIPINHYMEVDFKTFQGVVDAVGDVPIYFPYPTRDDGTGLYAPVAGCHELDGKGALAYARSRHIEYYSFAEQDWFDADATADLARIKRQQDFMRRLMRLAVDKSLTNPLTASKVVDRIIPNLKIDATLEKNDLLGLIDVFRGVDPNDSSKVQFLTIPGRNVNVSGASVLFVDEATAAAMISTLRGDSGTSSQPTTTQSTVIDSSGATTTTTAAPLPVVSEDRFGVPAPTTAPCG
ncbi:MAG: LytR family transcriptional regulator [Acidimicrobiia bacterium]|nr:LytR family transcriptional regulator [Acidimicrobiia bacterium]